MTAPGGGGSSDVGSDDGPEMIDALVHSGTADIPYRRAGRGRPVLLLTDAPDPAVDALMARLARTRLVVRPFVLPEPGGWGAWFETIVEGLGLDTPDVIAAPERLRELDTFVATHPGWVGRVDDIEIIDP